MILAMPLLICPFFQFLGDVFFAALCILLSIALLRYVFSGPCEAVTADALAQAREQAEALATELEALVKVNERWNAAVLNVIQAPESWNDSYLDDARAALAAYKETQP